MFILEEVKISSKGQLVVPKYLRDAVGMKSGDIVIVSKLDNKLMIMKKPDDPAKALIDSGKTIALKNIRREIKGE